MPRGPQRGLACPWPRADLGPWCSTWCWRRAQRGLWLAGCDLPDGGQSPGACYQQLSAANDFPGWLLACLATWSQHFSRAQHLPKEHLGHLMPCLRSMRQ